jgi:glycosyltransferase involved in cell wall biosynthesis
MISDMTAPCTGADDLPAQNPSGVIMRVLLVAPYTSRGGGMGRIMAYLAGHDPQAAISFEMIESRGGGGALVSLWPMLLAALRIWRWSRAPGVTVLHVNMAERGSVFRKGILLLWGRQLGLPTVLHLHAAEIVPSYDHMPRLCRLWVRHVFQSANVCVVLGQVWHCWLQDCLGVDSARIEILRNGVPRARVLPLPVAERHCVLVFLGNMQARKGLGDLLTALASDALRRREWTLIVAGGGDQVPYRDMAHALGVTAKVQFESWLNRDACTALLARAYALILPSYHEGLPLVLLEAASLGLPAIATPVGAIAEVFTDDENVLFVPPGDVSALAAAILRIVDDQRLRARLGQGAKKLYEGSLTLERFNGQLAQIYARHCLGDRNTA